MAGGVSGLLTEPPPVPVVATVSGLVAWVNAAVAVTVALSAKLHVGLELPAHGPLVHWLKLVALALLPSAVSWKLVPDGSDTEQAVASPLSPQLMLPSAEPTKSALEPGPVSTTVSCGLGIVGANVAVADEAPDIVIVHVDDVPAAAHAPPHSLNDEPACGVAVSVTAVPGGYAPTQAEPQSIVWGLSPLATVPFPVPSVVTVRSFGAKSAVTAAVCPCWFRIRKHVPEPADTNEPRQLPGAQPVKTESPVGVAVRVTCELRSKDLEHAVGQLIALPSVPVRSLVTEPVPVPVSETEMVSTSRVNAASAVVGPVTATSHRVDGGDCEFVHGVEPHPSNEVGCEGSTVACSTTTWP